MLHLFLPYDDCQKSIQSLHVLDLESALTHGFQIHNALKQTGGFSNFPDVILWQGYDDFLVAYYNKMLQHAKALNQREVNLKPLPQTVPLSQLTKPWWWGPSYPLHRSDRIRLLRKRPAFYERYKWEETAEDQTEWPKKEET